MSSRKDGHVLRALDIEVEGQRNKGRLKRNEKGRLEKNMMAALSKEDAFSQSKWIVGINQITTRLR